MKEFFRKQAYKFQQFMIGRYGIDKLWSVLLIFFFVIILLANAFYKVSKITYCACVLIRTGISVGMRTAHIAEIEKAWKRVLFKRINAVCNIAVCLMIRHIIRLLCISGTDMVLRNIPLADCHISKRWKIIPAGISVLNSIEQINCLGVLPRIYKLRNRF